MKYNKGINRVENSDHVNSRADKSKSYDIQPILSKPLSGYSREQLNYIYLFGIILHQIYYSVTGISLSEIQQRKTLSVQMRFFITVFPQHNVKEYFDFTKAFIDKNEGLTNYSVLEVNERSIQIFPLAVASKYANYKLYIILYPLFILRLEVVIKRL